MHIVSIVLKNYKSMRDVELNKLILEQDVTAIIGKNESGKTNIIDALSHISFFTRMNKVFDSSNINRNSLAGSEISYVIELKFTKDERVKFHSKKNTFVSITKDTSIMNGGATDLYCSQIKPKVDELLDLFPQNIFKLGQNDLIEFNKCRSALRQEEDLNLILMDNGLKIIDQHINDLSEDLKSAISSSFYELKQSWKNFKILFPTMFYRNPTKSLKTQYSLADVKSELKNSTVSSNLLSDFVKLINIGNNEFIEAVQPGTTPTRMTTRSKISENIRSIINEGFKEFYPEELVFLEATFDSGTVTFSVKTDDSSTLMLSERSNGLRWYLDTYIEMTANEIPNSNVVYLLDEPGVSLHVNAQLELLKLFNHLSDRGNQVIYTTHSPYMLNISSGNLHKIRSVVKDSNGNTSIYKTAYDSRISKESQSDTLAPIIFALGLNLHESIGPSLRKVNVVVEGMSDYIYLTELAKILTINLNDISLIPSMGASQVTNICQILYGWGCRFIAIYDYDKEGKREAKKMQEKFSWEYGEQFCFIKQLKNVQFSEAIRDSEAFTIENLIGKNEINNFCRRKNFSAKNGKALIAKLFCEEVRNKDIVLSNQTIKKLTSFYEYLQSIVLQ